MAARYGAACPATTRQAARSAKQGGLPGLTLFFAFGLEQCLELSRHLAHQVALVTAGLDARTGLLGAHPPGLEARASWRRPRSPPSALFEVDYLTVEHAKIYVGWSRRWAVV
ncbi:hypothetical protein ACFQ2B_01075 [Streptomyces stramineus]